MHEGLDLRDDLARFLIIPKVLYTAVMHGWSRVSVWTLDTMTGLLAARMVQACGRVIRGEGLGMYCDPGLSCILDLTNRAE